jgi:asparagine synthetase B (glutamine-hydrolysing)
LVAAAVLRKNPQARVLPFEQSVVKLSLNARDSVMTNAQALARIGGGGQDLKPLLKDIARRLVPPEVIDRPKMGFGVPLAAWLRGPLREWARDLLSEETVARHGILDGARVRASFDSLERGSDGESGRVWAACSLSAWLEHGCAGRR